MPHIVSAEWKVTIKNSTIYRVLIPGQKYRDADGNTQNLSPDFVIRSAQSWYTKETTSIRVSTNGTTQNYILQPGQRIIFSGDSRVSVVRGSLILFGLSSHTGWVDMSDRWLPLLPNDEIETGIMEKWLYHFLMAHSLSLLKPALVIQWVFSMSLNSGTFASYDSTLVLRFSSGCP